MTITVVMTFPESSSNQSVFAVIDVYLLDCPAYCWFSIMCSSQCNFFSRSINVCKYYVFAGDANVPILAHCGSWRQEGQLKYLCPNWSPDTRQSGEKSSSAISLWLRRSLYTPCQAVLPSADLRYMAFATAAMVTDGPRSSLYNY